MIKTLIVASCIALTSSSQLSMAGASQIGQTSATNLSGVVLAHVGNECSDVGYNYNHHNVLNKKCIWMEKRNVYKHTKCRKKNKKDNKHAHRPTNQGRVNCERYF